MALFLYVFPSYAGCVERVLVSTPFVRQVQGQQLPQPDPATTWGYIRQHQYPWPQGVVPKPYLLSKYTSPQQQQQAPDIMCIQIAHAEVSRQMVNSGMPVGAPVGNAGSPVSVPPMPGPKPPDGVKLVHSGLYEEIDSSGLPSVGDNMFGESDPSAGTYTDISVGGIEEKRTLQRPVGPPPQQR